MTLSSEEASQASHVELSSRRPATFHLKPLLPEGPGHLKKRGRQTAAPGPIMESARTLLRNKRAPVPSWLCSLPSCPASICGGPIAPSRELLSLWPSPRTSGTMPAHSLPVNYNETNTGLLIGKWPLPAAWPPWLIPAHSIGPKDSEL